MGQMIALMQEALLKKNPAEVFADRITRWFVPAVFLSPSGRDFISGWADPGPAEALLRGLTVLVISCPCALGIATPLVKVAAMGVGRRKGILVRDPAALEQVKDLDTLVFDKTGTLTEGNFDLQEIYSEAGEEKDILTTLGAVEMGSSHFLARTLVRKAREAGGKMEAVSHFEELEGRGVKGFVGGRTVLIGSHRFLKEEGLTRFFLFAGESGPLGRSGQNGRIFRMGRTRPRFCSCSATASVRGSGK